MAIKNGIPAFARPFSARDVHDGVEHYLASDGMTLRDYFAAKALPAVIAAYVEGNGRCIGSDHIAPNCSAIAFKFADQMLAEREANR